jgi:hypothetical protein
VEDADEDGEGASQDPWESQQFTGEWVSGSSVSAAGGCYAKSIQMYAPQPGEAAATDKNIAVPGPLFDSFSQSPQYAFEIKKECEVSATDCTPSMLTLCDLQLFVTLSQQDIKWQARWKTFKAPQYLEEVILLRFTI